MQGMSSPTSNTLQGGRKADGLVLWTNKSELLSSPVSRYIRSDLNQKGLQGSIPEVTLLLSPPQEIISF